jgi:hypothetical protein
MISVFENIRNGETGIDPIVYQGINRNLGL